MQINHRVKIDKTQNELNGLIKIHNANCEKYKKMNIAISRTMLYINCISVSLVFIPNTILLFATAYSDYKKCNFSPYIFIMLYELYTICTFVGFMVSVIHSNKNTETIKKFSYIYKLLDTYVIVIFALWSDFIENEHNLFEFLKINYTLYMYFSNAKTWFYITYVYYLIWFNVYDNSIDNKPVDEWYTQNYIMDVSIQTEDYSIV